MLLFQRSHNHKLDICILFGKNRFMAASPEQAWTKVRHMINFAALAKSLGITRGAVSLWKVVPEARVEDVHRFTRIPRDELRPDLYPSSKLMPWERA